MTILDALLIFKLFGRRHLNNKRNFPKNDRYQFEIWNSFCKHQKKKNHENGMAQSIEINLHDNLGACTGVPKIFKLGPHYRFSPRRWFTRLNVICFFNYTENSRQPVKNRLVLNISSGNVVFNIFVHFSVILLRVMDRA